MATTSEIKNLALFTIGFVDEIDFTDLTNATVKKVNRIYETTRNFVLSNYYWRFAQKRVKLTDRLQETDTFTANAGTDYITLATYNVADGLEVQLSTTDTLPAGLSTSTNYYMVNTTGKTAQLSATKGGTEIDITDTGSGTHTVTFTDIEDSPYKYLYLIPNDLLVMRGAFSDEYTDSPIRDYELGLDGLYTNDPGTSISIWLWYTQNIADTDFPVYFVDYFKYKLAMDLCFNLTGNTDLLQVLAQYEQKMLLTAKNIDAKQVKTRIVKKSPFIDIRG